MKKYLLIAIGIWLIGCDNGDEITPTTPTPNNPNPPSNNNDWLIPTNLIIDAAGRDAIPSLSNPELIDAQDAGYMFDPELVLGYFDGQTAIAFPHHIMDWHEIVNIRVNAKSVVISYCPLTGTGIGWSQAFDDFESEFAVSGLLYNNNLIAFDRNTGTNWSQQSLLAVNGPKIGTEIQTFNLVETRWSTWKSMYPDSKVVSQDTGWDRPYGNYPYGDFRSDHDDIFYPLTTDDRRLQRKERVHGVLINGEVKTYRFSSFGDNNLLIDDRFQDTDIIIVGNETSNFMVSFEAELSNGTRPTFSVIDEGATIITDEEGNKWDLFGKLVFGTDTLTPDLTPTKSFMGYWFSWGAFYPTPEIFEF